LERNFIKLINDRRQELSVTDHQQNGTVHAAFPTSVAGASVPQPHATLLAAAVPADR
jgi:hypothetical protein